MREENARRSSRVLDAIAAEAFMGVDLTPTLNIDYEISSRSSRRNTSTFSTLSTSWNPPAPQTPARCSAAARTRARANTVGKGEHLKLVLGAGSNQLDAIAFRQAPCWKRCLIMWILPIPLR